ncbi:MAG: carbohydrate kinase family protein [Proteobacteria bacterium]|jgi:adenosine kinase|nr:carbohydrate kinase family protein [Pseudomonadota bacterium]MDA1300045.1 carbohydrate kinase family protein [Pseudomonadota bacterium]
MSPWVLVCGSIALDYIGHYQGSFSSYQSRYGVEALNISLQLTDFRTSYGGCGINIAYGLHQLGVPVLPLSAAGANFMDHYHQHLTELGVDTRYIAVDASRPQCATALVISDDHGNQITGFHAGASDSPLRKLPSAIPGIEDCKVAILAPENAPIMLRQARDLKAMGIQTIFDPGQGIAAFQGEEIRELLSLCQSLIINVHEYEILQHNARLGTAEIEQMMGQVIVTHGVGGVDVLQGGEVIHVNAVPDVEVVDATGCGDAFRAGWLYGQMHHLPIRRGAELGCVMAAINLRHRDTQTYRVTEASLLAECDALYGPATR